MKTSLLFLSIGLWAWASPSMASPQKIAVLEFINKAKLSGEETAYLADLVRNEATKLSQVKFSVMTRENMLTMLPEGTDLANCQGKCEVETGRNVGADYVVSGRIIKFGSTLKVSVKMHKTQNGLLIAGDRASAKTLEALEKPVIEASHRLFARLGQLSGIAPRKTAAPTGDRPKIEKAVPPDAKPSYEAAKTITIVSRKQYETMQKKAVMRQKQLRSLRHLYENMAGASFRSNALFRIGRLEVFEAQYHHLISMWNYTQSQKSGMRNAPIPRARPDYSKAIQVFKTILEKYPKSHRIEAVKKQLRELSQ